MRVTEYVPAPDEQAIERAARTMYERGYPEGVREGWETYSARQPGVAGRFRESVRAILAAALEQSESPDSDSTASLRSTDAEVSPKAQ
jgi:hypothetical protein